MPMRRCADPHCGTVLSRYNDATHCWVHDKSLPRKDHGQTRPFLMAALPSQRCCCTSPIEDHGDCLKCGRLLPFAQVISLTGYHDAGQSAA